MSDWRSFPCGSVHREFLEELTKILLECAFGSCDRKEPVVKWRDAEYLRKILDFELCDQPKDPQSLLLLVRQVVTFSVKTGHPYFMNQLFSGLDPYGLAGQWLTDTLNASPYTYEVAPVLTTMERVLTQKLLRMFYKEDHVDEFGDGLFCPGGSFANGLAINLARYWFKPEVKAKGTSSLELVLFASEDAHYSVLKWASLCGIGDENVILVKTDELGRMDVLNLEANILKEQERGKQGFMICATAGTTVLGAFDPLNEIADLCYKFKMWLHVDAAWGGGVIFSKKYSGLLRGIERADSITFNPHKLLAVPQQCSLLLTKHRQILKAAHSKGASYLFQKDKFYPPQLDSGDKYVQCGRKPDVLKFWLMWQAKGSCGFEKHVDHLMSISACFKDQIERRESFVLVTEPCFINVCFWYVPPSLRNKQSSASYNEMLNKIAPMLKEKMTKRGSLMMSYQPLRSKPNFFRFVIQNSAVDVADIDYILEEFENLGSCL